MPQNRPLASVVAFVTLSALAATARAQGSGGEEVPSLSAGQSRVVDVTKNFSMIYYSFHFADWANGATFLITTYAADLNRTLDDTVLKDSVGDINGTHVLDDDGGPGSYSQAIYERRGAYQYVLVRGFADKALNNTKVVITRLR